MPEVIKRGNYGLDSPGIVATLLVLGLALLLLGNVVSRAWRWVAYFAGGYFLLSALGMLFYSKVGKLKLAQRLLDKISWQGDERVLDLGCGRGLLTVAAALRVPKGCVTAVDVWNRAEMSANRSESVLENARIERVEDRVEVKQGEAQDLPFPAGALI